MCLIAAWQPHRYQRELFNLLCTHHNLGSHKSKAVRRAIRAAGARLFYLPKYSPDLNPIEQFFAKLKHWLRKAASRTPEAVYNAIAPILQTVSPAECANYFTNAGYHQT